MRDPHLRKGTTRLETLARRAFSVIPSSWAASGM